MPIIDGTFHFDPNSSSDQDLDVLYALSPEEISTALADADLQGLAQNYQLGTSVVWFLNPDTMPGILQVLEAVATRHPHEVISNEHFMESVAVLIHHKHTQNDWRNETRQEAWQFFKEFVYEHADEIAETTTIQLHSMIGGYMGKGKFEYGILDKDDDAINPIPLLEYLESLKEHLTTPDRKPRPNFPEGLLDQSTMNAIDAKRTSKEIPTFVFDPDNIIYDIKDLYLLPLSDIAPALENADTLTLAQSFQFPNSIAMIKKTPEELDAMLVVLTIVADRHPNELAANDRFMFAVSALMREGLKEETWKFFADFVRKNRDAVAAHTITERTSSSTVAFNNASFTLEDDLLALGRDERALFIKDFLDAHSRFLEDPTNNEAPTFPTEDFEMIAKTLRDGKDRATPLSGNGEARSGDVGKPGPFDDGLSPEGNGLPDGFQQPLL